MVEMPRILFFQVFIWSRAHTVDNRHIFQLFIALHQRLHQSGRLSDPVGENHFVPRLNMAYSLCRSGNFFFISFMPIHNLSPLPYSALFLEQAVSAVLDPSLSGAVGSLVGT